MKKEAESKAYTIVKCNPSCNYYSYKDGYCDWNTIFQPTRPREKVTLDQRCLHETRNPKTLAEFLTSRKKE